MNWIMESESDWESCRSARHGDYDVDWSDDEGEDECDDSGGGDDHDDQ